MIHEKIILVRWNLKIEGTRRDELIRSIRADPDWHRRRLELWKRFGYPSLKNQNIHNFKVWLLCDPDEHDQEQALFETIDDERFCIVLDFEKALRALSDDGNPEDNFLFARMDSDDMYHPDLLSLFAANHIHADLAGLAYIQAMRGYGLDLSHGELYEWNNPSPPFFCIVRRRMNLNIGFKKGPDIVDHGTVAAMSYKIVSRPLFIVTLNETNVCNSLQSSWVGKRIPGGARILKEEYHIE